MEMGRQRVKCGTKHRSQISQKATRRERATHKTSPFAVFRRHRVIVVLKLDALQSRKFQSLWNTVWSTADIYVSRKVKVNET
jgi:hypothetical protein